MKKLKVKSILREIGEGAVLGLFVTGIFAGAVKINAMGTPTELKPEYIAYCEKAGEIYNICPELLQAVIEEESNGYADAVSRAGEIGLMQIYPQYHRVRAEHLGVYDLFDPEGNIMVGADYLHELFIQYGDTGTVLMVYNGVKNAESRGVDGEYTRYAEDIMARTCELERANKK